MGDIQNPRDALFDGEKKIVVVGQSGCGKSSLIASFVSEGPVGMVVDDPEDIRKTISFGRERVTVVLREVRPHLKVSNLRMIDYIGSSVALICFALNDAVSIKSVPIWIYELTQVLQIADLSVVGCKLDLKHMTPVTAKEWMDLERAILPYKYLECSAKTGEGVSHLVRVVGNVLIN